MPKPKSPARKAKVASSGAAAVTARRAARRRPRSAPAERGRLWQLLVTMRLAREWDLRFENLLRTGAVAKWYSAVGNEALTVAAASLLRPGDALATLHRDSGALFARFLDIEALFAALFDREETAALAAARERARRYLYRLACQMMAGADGFTGGVDRSYHFGSIDEAAGDIHVGMISHLGAMVPVAAGLAWALAERRGGGVALNFIGDGGTSTGDFHEGLNLAAVWKLPLVLIIENNRFAFSTPASEQYACESLAQRGAGYGIPGVQVDGTDPLAVLEAVEEALARARSGKGPSLIEAMLGRMRGHSEQDRSLDMVPTEERELYRLQDPLRRFEERLLADRLVDQEQLERAAAQARQLLIEITDEARAGPEPDPAALLAERRVFAGPAEASSARGAGEEERPPALSEKGGASYLEAIRRALAEELERDPQVAVIGQDVAAFGGAFKVTEGLCERFGAARVRNTPICESGAIGLAAGAALLGQRPVVEMQFADFISCGFNQVVNVAAKNFFRWRRPVPIVIRLPYGGGAGAGPFHSQCPEAWFTHVAGLKVVAPAFPGDALGLLKTAIRDPDPVIYLEHKFLYRRVREELPAGEHLVPLGRARIVRSGRDLSIIAYGWMVHRALEAAALLAAEGIETEVVDLRSLVPLDEETILASARRTSKALVVHEAQLGGGFGGELAARLGERLFEWLDGPVRRLAFPDLPVPCHPALEAACLPDAVAIAQAARELARY